MKVNANDAIVGLAAGVIATVPMTVAMEGLHDALAEHDGPLPPREVTEGLLDRIGAQNLPDRPRQRLTFLLHFTYGGAAGALFGILAPRRVPEATAAGTLYGLAVWTGSYIGLLPATHLRRHARHDSAERTTMMVAAHLVWGATLGMLVGSRPGRRATSKNPDASTGNDRQLNARHRTMGHGRTTSEDASTFFV